MWNEKIMRVIPAMLFLFCLLEIFELGLIIGDMNKIEKLEYELQQNLKVVEMVTDLLKKYSECT